MASVEMMCISLHASNDKDSQLCVCTCCRFDLEQNQAQDEVQRERIQREKLAREKDVLTGEVFTIKQQLQVRCVCMDVCRTHSIDLISL